MLFDDVGEDAVEVQTLTQTDRLHRELLPLVHLALQGLQAGLDVEVPDDEPEGGVHEGSDPQDAEGAGHDGAVLAGRGGANLLSTERTISLSMRK